MNKRTGISVLILLLMLLSLVLNACKNRQETALNAEQYKRQIDKWHKKRVERLTAPEGWLSLAGLFWLRKGKNSFGFGINNDIRFPFKKNPLHLGRIDVNGDEIKVRLAKDAPVLINGKPLKESTLKSDADWPPTKMSYDSLVWYVIKRGDLYAIRLKNKNNPAIHHFLGIERFPVRLKWRIKARFVPYDSPKKILIPTMLGTTVLENTPGYLSFKVKDKFLRLDVLANSVKDTLSIIFADETNGKETYRAGRFLEVPSPDKDGFTYIDFNKAYNPPCDFTEFATCPLPPKQNYLPIAVTTGEMQYKSGVHH